MASWAILQPVLHLGQDQPAAWQGKAPCLEKVVEQLRPELLVATITSEGTLLIPKDIDVQSIFPEVSPELAKVLADLRTQFPPPPSLAEAVAKPEAPSKSVAGSKRHWRGIGKGGGGEEEANKDEEEEEKDE